MFGPGDMIAVKLMPQGLSTDDVHGWVYSEPGVGKGLGGERIWTMRSADVFLVLEVARTVKRTLDENGESSVFRVLCPGGQVGYVWQAWMKAAGER